MTGCTFENNRLGWNAGHKNYYGIKVYGWAAGNHLVADNTCSYNTKHGIFLANSFVGNNTVTGNTCQYNGQNGIYLNECWYNTVSNNISSNNQEMGIQLWISDYNLIKNNTFSSNDDSAGTGAGIWLDDSDNNDLFENTCENNAEQGISLKGSYNQLWNNDSSSNGKDGIYIYNSASSTGNTIIGNTFSSNNWDGIDSSGGADYNMFSGNTVTGNSEHGINFWGNCHGNFVVENVISNHTSVGYKGLRLENTSTGNRAYLNTFTSNAAHVEDSAGRKCLCVSRGPGIWATTSPQPINPKWATIMRDIVQRWVLSSKEFGTRPMTWPAAPAPRTPSRCLNPCPTTTARSGIWRTAVCIWRTRPKKGGGQPIAAGATLTWISASAARSDVNFSAAGSNPWSGQVSFADAPATGDQFAVTIGSCDEPDCSGGFNSGLVTWTFQGDNSTKSFAADFCDTAFTLLAGDYLAVTIKNTSSVNYDLLDGGAWSFISCPDASDIARATGDFYVKNGGSDTFSGASWTTAYETIQFALNQAKVDEGSKTIHVAAGAYTESLNLNPGSDITLLGGYPAGGGTARDPAVNVTTISGTGLDTFYIKNSQNITVDGFFIQNGNTGGIAGENNEYLSIVNCTIQNNLGNVLLYNISNLSLTDNTIQNAVSMCGVQCSNCSGTIANNTITNNHGNEGAGIHISGVNSASAVKDNTITGNTANGSGGGMYVDNCYNLTIADNIISNNTTDDDAAGSDGSGGGIFCTKSPIEIRRNLIQNNGGTSPGGNGAGVYVYETVNAELVNNVVTGNTGTEYGGGVNLDADSTAILTNNTIANNAATDTGSGVGLYNGASMTFVNGIVWGNTGDGIFDQAGAGSSTTVTYSDVQGGVLAGAGNLSENPPVHGRRRFSASNRIPLHRRRNFKQRSGPGCDQNRPTRGCGHGHGGL